MASIRPRTRANGSTCYAVLFRVGGKQTSESFDDPFAAARFRNQIDKIGAEQALQLLAAEVIAATDAPSLTDATNAYIDNLTGVEDGTRNRYRRFLANDLAPFFGANTPVDAIGDNFVARWINHLDQIVGNSPKTIANKHGFLYAFMASLAKSGTIPSNPCEGSNLPRVDQAEMVFLEEDEFGALCGAITERRWWVFIDFLVASGTRFGEASALRVGDIDRKRHTCTIRRAWKYTGGKRVLGRPKTKRSNRTIDLDADIIGELRLDGRGRDDWLFTGNNGGPVQISTFYKQVWAPAIEKLVADPDDPLNGKRPRIHDLRHTCASWMLGENIPLHVVQRHLGHESITTTSDRYGHLDRRAGAAAAAVIGAKLSRKAKPVLSVVEDVA